MRGSLLHEPLLARVAERLESVDSTTDHLLLLRWRILALCQYLVASPSGQTAKRVADALDVFVSEGAGPTADAAIATVSQLVGEEMEKGRGGVLPNIAPAKREEVLARLREYEMLGGRAEEKALAVLPELRERLRERRAGALLAGIRHRLELVAALVRNVDARSEAERARAAAAILYLDELQDAIPDTLGLVGLLDDDFALRVVLEQLGEHSEDEILHWSEIISSLWDDLPFLRGVRLSRDGRPVATTWLDRVNSYASYSHALDRVDKLLILVQPSVVCSLLHPIVSLIGLLVLDSLTSSRNVLKSLEEGRTYEIDGKFYCRCGGESKEPQLKGRVALCFRDGIVYRPATIARRMVSAPEKPLSTAKLFSSELHPDDDEPIQRFFRWQEAIGAGAISARILLVTTRQRATEMFGGIQSNGVYLLDQGLVRFAGLYPSPDILRSGLVLVVPNLTVARELVDRDVDVSAIIVDGYQRLHRGRHDLPFLLRRPAPPPTIVWSSTGYYPVDSPEWLPEHRQLEVSAEELADVLQLDGDIEEGMAPGLASLWEAVTGSNVTKVLVEVASEERRILEAIDEFLAEVRNVPELPGYWRYHLLSSATTLHALVTATPCCWSDVREMGAVWGRAFDEQWARLRSRTAEMLQAVADSHRRIVEALESVSAERNTRADALIEFLGGEDEGDWRLVCDRSEQVRLAGRFARQAAVGGFKPVLLRDLGVCRACIVVGWRTQSFGRRIWAHTPRRLIALVTEKEGQSWERVADQVSRRSGESLLEAVGYRPTQPSRVRKGAEVEVEPNSQSRLAIHEPDPREGERSVQCVFLWLADEPEGKILANDARVLMEVGDQARERRAYRIKPENRVVLGPGTSRWSPADEFTEAVVGAIEASHPQLVRDVKEWRRALSRLREDRGWSLETLRSKLKEVGVSRESQTLAGWLRLEEPAPIGPQHIQREVDAIWEIVGSFTERRAADVADACSRLRSMRSSAGRALLKLWKGRTVNLGVDETWLDALVEELRQEVQVHEIDAVTYGRVPETMLGWWIAPEVAEEFEVPKTPSMNENPREVLSEDD